MNTRVLPLGNTYTGSKGSVHAPVAVHTPAPVHTPAHPHALVQAPVTYGNRAPVVVYQQVAPTNSSSIVALVLGLISFISSFFFLGFVGIIFGHIARSQIKARGERGNGMAVAGLWLSYLSVLFWIVFWLLYFGVIFGVIALVIGASIAAGNATVS